MKPKSNTAKQGMNEIVKFIQKHPHCTKWLCGTCGGLWGFLRDLDEWIDHDNPNLADLVISLKPEDVTNIQEWPVYLDLIFNRISAEEKPKIEAAPIIPVMISGLTEIRRQEQVERDRANRLKAINEESKKVKQKEKAIREELQRVKQKEKEEWLVQINKLTPMDRLKAILDEKTCTLADYPVEWANLPIESFYGFNSIELTHFIQLLTEHKVPNRGEWKVLRSSLCQLRQRVYNQEKGYSK